MALSQKTLPKPALERGYLASPKTLLAYLKMGCEIQQVGCDQRSQNDPAPDYFLVNGMYWEVPVHPRHAQALETLELITLDCGDGKNWYSRASFSVPALETPHA